MSEWTPVAGLRVAIDGPSGSGKGTIASMVGEAIGLAVMDTGLLYRFLGWQANEMGVDLDDESAVIAIVDAAVAKMEWRVEGIFFENRDCTPLLRGEDVGAYASKVAVLPAIRKQLLELQRKIASSGCVMDGRDIGTVVLPDAEAKFFLTASQRERARRRWAQLQQSDTEVVLDQIVADLKARDARDSGRECSPLERAKDAIEIDSTTMRIDEVVDRVLAVLERRKLIS
ncbi:(d)CMP kinase [Pseudomonadota bacterium]